MTNIIVLTDAMIAGGMERQIVELLGGGKKQDEVCFFLGVLARGGTRLEEANELVEGVVPWRQAANPSWSIVVNLPYYFWKLFSYLRFNKIHIIHTFGCFSDLLGLSVGKALGIPVINGSIRSARPQLMRRDRLSKFCMLRSDQVVANSRAGLSSFDVQIDPLKLHVIYNGVNLQRFARIKSLTQKDCFTLCMVGNFTSKKDHMSLVKVLALVVGKIKNIQLIFVGRGKLVEQCRKYVEKLSLSDKVTFITDCDHPEPYIAKADVGILLTNTKVHGEGISNAILEYMALKKPVIATEYGGNIELVDHEQSGFLVQNNEHSVIADCVYSLFKEPQKAQEMGLKGRQKLEEQFGLDRMISAYLQLYKYTVKNKTVGV